MRSDDWQDAGRSTINAGGGLGSSYNPQMGSEFGALGGLLGGLFGGGYSGPSPMQAASPYMRQIPGTLEKYLAPYAQMGQQMIPQMQQLYGGLVSDPNAELAKIGQGYQASPGYAYQRQQSLDAANQAAAAGGMAGSPESQLQNQQIASQLANQDYQQYMQNALGLYGQGLTGMQGLESQGFQGAQGLAQALSDFLLSQGQMAAGQAEQAQSQAAQNQSGLMSDIGGLASSIAGFL